MKVSVFPLALLLSVSSHSVAQTVSVDSLVQNLFLSLKAKDEKAYMNIFPSYAQTKNVFRRSVERMKGNVSVPDTRVNMDSILDAELKNFTEENYKTEIQGNLKKSFHSVLKQGEEKGLNWSRAQLTSYRLDTISEPSTDMRSVSGVLQLKDSARVYELFFTDAIFFEDEKKWYGASLNKIVRRGEHPDDGDHSLPAGKEEQPAPPVKPKASAQKPKS